MYTLTRWGVAHRMNQLYARPIETWNPDITRDFNHKHTQQTDTTACS